MNRRPLNRLGLLAFCAGSLLACESKRPSPAEPGLVDAAQEAESGTAAQGSVKARTYGAPLTPQATTQLGDLLASPDAYAGKTVLVEGQVRRACSAKGCWLEIGAKDTADGPACRVTFKDYGFFVPTDSAGAAARIQGTVEITQVKQAHVEHLEAEGATFSRKDEDGSATELRIVATGVELSRG